MPNDPTMSDRDAIVYLDHHATTPCDPLVVEAMLPYFSDLFANPGNGFHALGRRVQRDIEQARERLAKVIGATAEEIIFTGGSTESINLAILGLADLAEHTGRRRIVTTAVEHSAVRGAVAALTRYGFEAVVLPVDATGQVELAAAAEAITTNTLLVSVQAANHEVGTIQPVREVAELARATGALVHCDATQAVGKVQVDVRQMGADLLSFSGHKLYGPKGVGALYARGGLFTKLAPLHHGGGQERGLRPGTLNVPAVVGFGVACELADSLIDSEYARQSKLRDLFEERLASCITRVHFNGGSHRLPGCSSVSLTNSDAEAVIAACPRLVLGTGSACSSGALEPSPVLSAIGLSRDTAHATVRVTFGRSNVTEHVDLAVDDIAVAVNSIGRFKSPPRTDHRSLSS